MTITLCTPNDISTLQQQALLVLIRNGSGVAEAAAQLSSIPRLRREPHASWSRISHLARRQRDSMCLLPANL